MPRGARQSVITRKDSILNRSPSRPPSSPAAARISSSSDPSASLEVIAGVLEVLQGVEDPTERRRLELEAELGGLQLERRTSGELAHDNPRPVADEIRRHVLVRVRPPSEGARVQPGLVGERRGADIRPLGIEGQVDELGDVVSDRRKALEPVGRDRLYAHLERQVGDRRREVGVARVRSP